jgi:RNA polymerase-binding transcription factor DksA
MRSNPDTTRHHRYRTELARCGMAVNEQLTRLLAGQNVTLATLKLPHEQSPGLRSEEKLRRFLAQIIRAQRRLDTPAWGHCVDCGAGLPPQALDDAPWLERCSRCEEA